MCECDIDILLLVEYIFNSVCSYLFEYIKGFLLVVLCVFSVYMWLGNVWELINCIWYVVVMCEDGIIKLVDFDL